MALSQINVIIALDAKIYDYIRRCPECCFESGSGQIRLSVDYEHAPYGVGKAELDMWGVYHIALTKVFRDQRVVISSDNFKGFFNLISKFTELQQCLNEIQLREKTEATDY